MQILFVSTHNFATNPRLVKEIILALNQGYKVAVVCCEFDNWSKQINETIVQSLQQQIQYFPVSGNRKPFMPWLLSSCWYQLAKLSLLVFPKNSFLLSVKSNKRSWLLMQQLKRMNLHPQLVIAHNPGSFYPAWRFAQKNNIPLGIDLEDYHPGETLVEKDASFFRRLNKTLLPKAAYVSAAAPLILSYSKNDLDTNINNELLLLNYFSAAEFSVPIASTSNDLKLVWFSQNISYGRGLEEILPVVSKFPQVSLHLYGNAEEDFVSKWIKGLENVFIHGPLPQHELHKVLSEYDVGLALEKPSSNLNRDLCLTNKIMAYYQAGLYILASETQAQVSFAAEHPNCVQLCRLETNSLEGSIKNMIQQKEEIRAKAAQRYKEASLHSWEVAGQTLVNTWKKVTAPTA